MGYYINKGLDARDKALALVELYEAKEIQQPEKFDDIANDKAIIVVIDNGGFEAAGYCYSEREFADFTNPRDPRQKTFLVMDKKLAEELTGYSR